MNNVQKKVGARILNKKSASDECIASYDNMIESYSSLQDENSRIPSYEKKQNPKMLANKMQTAVNAKAQMDEPGSATADNHNNNTEQTANIVAPMPETNTVPAETVHTLTAPAFNQQHAPYDHKAASVIVLYYSQPLQLR